MILTWCLLNTIVFIKNQREVETRRSDVLSEIDPIEAYSYEHYINDAHKGEVNEIIAMHLYCEELFDIADGFVNECGEVELRDKIADLRSEFKNLQEIISAVRICEIELPLCWVSEYQESLGVKYLNVIENTALGTSGIHEAVIYARTHLTPLTLTNKHNRNGLSCLMCCLLHQTEQSIQVLLDAKSPYFHLFDGSNKQNLIAGIERQFCFMIGQCTTDPLCTFTSVGAKFLSGVSKAF